MKRFLIFAAIAPPLGFIVAFWVMLQIANWLAGSPGTFDVAQVMMLPTIYLVGLIPALLVAWFDRTLSTRNLSHRVPLTALFGYAISYLPLGFRPWPVCGAVRSHRRRAVCAVFVAGYRAAGRDRRLTAASPGQNSHIRLVIVRGQQRSRLPLLLCHSLQLFSQVGATLLHLVAQFAPGKGSEGGIGKLLPGVAQPLLHSADVGIKNLRLVHSPESQDGVAS